MLKTGPVYSVITPFKHCGRIDYEALRRYLDLLIDVKAPHIYSMAFNGKYETLSAEEILTLNTFIITYIKARSQETVVTCGDEIFCPATRTLQLANIYADLGCDLISVYMGERYYSFEQVLAFYDFLGTHSELPLLVHEMKLQNGAGGPDILWPVDLIGQLLDRQYVYAIKEDSKDDVFLQKIADKTSSAHFILSGGGMKRWRGFQNVAYYQSWLNGVGVVFPEIEAFYYDRYQNGELSICEHIEEQVEKPFFDLLAKVYWHQLTKIGLQWRGLMLNCERLPMTPASAELVQEVESTLEHLKSKILSAGCVLLV
jgi:dihydrodipicolinate synthase/N-acetylneuraminate lyase